jgi:hypothetical protein
LSNSTAKDVAFGFAGLIGFQHFAELEELRGQ